MNPWLIGSIGLLIIWGAVFLIVKKIRREML